MSQKKGKVFLCVDSNIPVFILKFPNKTLEISGEEARDVADKADFVCIQYEDLEDNNKPMWFCVEFFGGRCVNCFTINGAPMEIHMYHQLLNDLSKSVIEGRELTVIVV